MLPCSVSAMASFDHLIHIHITVHTKLLLKRTFFSSSARRSYLSKSSLAVFGSFTGYKRSFALLPCCRIFSGDDGLWLCSELEVFMFDDPCVRNLIICVVHYCISLIVAHLHLSQISGNGIPVHRSSNHRTGRSYL